MNDATAFYCPNEPYFDISFIHVSIILLDSVMFDFICDYLKSFNYHSKLFMCVCVCVRVCVRACAHDEFCSSDGKPLGL